MSDERRDDEILGRALGRAIETLHVNETPYERSRMASPAERRALFGLPQVAATIAVVVLAVALGAWFNSVREAREVPAVGSPTAVPGTTAPAAVATPVASIDPNRDRIWVYFARDSLPPVGAYLQGILDDSSSEGRTTSRLSLLMGLQPSRVPAGLLNPLGSVSPAVNGSRQTGLGVHTSGDKAFVEFDLPTGWGAHGSAQSLALLQQIVYTITEEPGINYAVITDKGRQSATIDQLVVDKPLSREDVFGYANAAKPDKIEDGGTAGLADIVDWRASVDQVAPGLGRFVVELKPQTATTRPTPRFTAVLQPSRETTPGHGKWTILISMPDAVWNQPSGEAFHCCPLKVVETTPIRELTAGPLTGDPPTGNGAYRGVGFGINLDDARPWRAFVLQDPLRLVIDVGGTAPNVSDRIAIYRAQPVPATPVCSTTCDIQLSGAARVFEANVVWRVKDSAGKVIANGHFLASVGSSALWGTFDTDVQVPPRFTGNVTLEVYEASPKDGSEQGLVQIPLVIR